MHMPRIFAKAKMQDPDLKKLGIASGIQGGWRREDIGTPRMPVIPGRPDYTNRTAPYYGTAVINVPTLVQPWPLMVAGVSNPGAYGSRPIPKVLDPIVARANGPRKKGFLGITWPGGVAAQTPQSESLGYTAPQRAVAPPYGTVLANPVNPLFGRPGFQYLNRKPSGRTGPTLKGAPGTGGTGIQSDRSRGIVAPGFASQQYMPVTQFDYSPTQDPDYNLGYGKDAKRVIPRSIGVGVDGVALVGTYRAHDFTPADRFFKQGRSSSNWQDMSFGPSYRFLLMYQQSARYNLYNQISPARPLSPNNYFLGYQMQPGIAKQLGGVVGQGIALGYGAS